MCHNSVLENEQIEKCIENGMPTKIIKTIKYTMRKRAANKEINQEIRKQQQITSYESSTKNIDKIKQTNSQESLNSSPPAIISKCPFGHGKFTTPAATIFSIPLTPPTTTTTIVSTLMADDLKFSNKNNNNNSLYERFPQISQLNTAITTTPKIKLPATVNGNTIRNLSGHFDDDHPKLLLDTGKIYNDDILAKSTQLTREFAYTMQQAIRRLQSSKIYTLLTKTTQPAHLMVVGIVTIVLLTVWPELFDGNNSFSGQQSTKQPPHFHQQQHSAHEHILETSMSSDHRQEMSIKRNDMLAVMAYLGAFSTHFGAQIWMTFVSGLSLYFSLPRHMFGQCQQILFPKYFAINAVLSITMLILYVKFFLNTWTLASCIQLGSLALTGAIELLVRLYLAPPLLRLMHEKYKIEDTIGSGNEIGSLVQGDLIKCPHYQRIHKAFRRVHMTVAIGNMITMVGSCLQLYYIASQLQISIVF